MNLFDTTQLAVERAIAGASQRNEAISNNLANANTPGFMPKDVDFHSALAAALGRGGHDLTDVRDSIEATSFEAEPDGTAQMRADGSGFDVDAAGRAAGGQRPRVRGPRRSRQGPHRHP